MNNCTMGFTCAYQAFDILPQPHRIMPIPAISRIAPDGAIQTSRLGPRATPANNSPITDGACRCVASSANIRAVNSIDEPVKKEIVGCRLRSGIHVRASLALSFCRFTHRTKPEKPATPASGEVARTLVLAINSKPRVITHLSHDRRNSVATFRFPPLRRSQGHRSTPRSIR